jgi:ketosteroid isomerase-like protein
MVIHATHERSSEMAYDNEAIVRHAYHLAEGNVLDVAGFVACFTEDGVFDDIVGGKLYEGQAIGDTVTWMGNLLPDVHRELRRVTTLGDVVAVELSIQGTFEGPLDTPAGAIQPTGAKIDIPTADFWYMQDGKVKRFNCYVGYVVMYTQMGAPPDFASAVAAAPVAR